MCEEGTLVGGRKRNTWRERMDEVRSTRIMINRSDDGRANKTQVD